MFFTMESSPSTITLIASIDTVCPEASFSRSGPLTSAAFIIDYKFRVPCFSLIEVKQV
jgi:hypothetical protein